jgi:hypothetical protein
LAYSVFHLRPDEFWRISPLEWSHMVEGRAHELDRQRRFAARWIAPLLSATAGQVVTEAQLLGEADTPAVEQAKKVQAAQRKLAKVQKQLEKVKGV